MSLLEVLININRVRGKFETVEFILRNGYINLLALGITKLCESFPLNQFYVAEYACIRNDQTASGVGLLLYIRSDIPHRWRYDL